MWMEGGDTRRQHRQGIASPSNTHVQVYTPSTTWRWELHVHATDTDPGSASAVPEQNPWSSNDQQMARSNS